MWHYLHEGQTIGPLAEAELDNLVSSGTLPANTLVWRDGMGDWQPYDQVRSPGPVAANPPIEVPRIRLQGSSPSEVSTASAPGEPTENTEAINPLNLAADFSRRARMEAVSSWAAVGVLLIAMIMFVGMLAGRSSRRHGPDKAGFVETYSGDEAKPARKPAANRKPKATTRRPIEEEVLLTLATNNTRPIWIDVSPDAKHTACLYKGELKLSPEKQKEIEAELDTWLKGRGRLTKTMDAIGSREKRGIICVDGVLHFPISHSGVRTFSPDSRHFAYIVKNEEDEAKKQSDGTLIRKRYDYFLVLDGKPVAKPYATYTDAHPGLSKLQFSADSSTWSCIALKSENPEQYVVLINGHEERVVENPETKVLFGPAGSNYAYQVESSGLVISSGKSLGPNTSVNSVQFSGDGQHLGFFAERTNRDGQSRESFLVIDGAETPLAKDETGYRLFMTSGDIPRVFVTRQGAKGRIYLNGKPGQKFEDMTDITLSPDGEHVAYIGRNRREYHVVFDDKVWPDYGRVVSKPVFSRDGQHLACWIRAKENQHVRVVADGTPQTEFIKEDSESLAYSPSGDHLPYVAKNSTNWVLVLDGVERSIPGGNASPTLVVSPDGKRVAIATKSTGSAPAFCFLEGERQNPYAEIEAMTFSRDGRHLVYIAQDKRRGAYGFGDPPPYHVVVDGDEGPELDEIIRVGDRKLWFDDAGQICYVAVRKNNVISFRENLRSY